MNLKDPIPAYNGADTVEVHILQNMLDDAGIDAFIVDDESRAGIWWAGLLPEIHKPQVWIERADSDRAKPILDEYERLIAERRAADADHDTKVQPIAVTCDECHTESIFPHAQIGSVQVCPSCGAYVDVTLDTIPDDQRVMTGEV